MVRAGARIQESAIAVSDSLQLSAGRQKAGHFLERERIFPEHADDILPSSRSRSKSTNGFPFDLTSPEMPGNRFGGEFAF